MNSSKKSNNLKCLFALGLMLFFISCNKEDVFVHSPPEDISLTESVYYYIDLNNRSDDKFKVKCYLENLNESNGIYQFPAVVPGTYSTSDIGRFVTKFEAFDQSDQLIPTEKINTNQWKISDPSSTKYIKYEILETWDHPMEGGGVYRMEGSSIENDHVLLNAGAILGYPTGLKDRTYFIEISYPKSWKIGTSLERTSENVYQAKNYNYLVDSPILLGRLSETQTTVDQTNIGIYTYSKTDAVTSSDIEPELQSIMADASAFLKTLPVDRYNFLYHFEDFASGALEHSFSSVYVLREASLSVNYISSIKSISAHELFHVVTPLNIHSEIIEDFNFVIPTPSAHLWLYEGVTEWASHMMQFRNGSITSDYLFQILKTKHKDYKIGDENLSLQELSLISYTEKGGQEFYRIYTKGALVAYLLDIRLLELSNGEKGLRELILDLIEIYGEDQPFDDQTFLEDLVILTYPEVGDFFESYIEGTEPFPIQEYFQKIGIDFDEQESTFSFNTNPSAGQQFLYNKWSVNF